MKAGMVVSHLSETTKVSIDNMASLGGEGIFWSILSEELPISCSKSSRSIYVCNVLIVLANLYYECPIYEDNALFGFVCAKGLLFYMAIA